MAAFLFLAASAMAAPDDLVLDIASWDVEKAETISGWFTDAAKVRMIDKSVADSAPTRKAIEAAHRYLSETFPELPDDASLSLEKKLENNPSPPEKMGQDPFASEKVKVKVKSWDFIEMSIHPIDFGRGRETLISWKPSESGLFYYALKFRPQMENGSAYSMKTVVLLPNLEVVPYRTLPATKGEQKQIIWWEKHLGHDTPLNKKEALPQPETK